MKKCKLCWSITILLIAFIAVMGYKFVVVGSVEVGDDGRTAVLVTDGERQMILGEMRVFLEGVQGITSAIANDDMPQVATLATSVGMASTGGEPAGLIAKLPLEFKTLGMSTHQAFDDLAKTATDTGDSQLVLSQFSDIMLNCTACHGGYRFKVTNP